MARLFATFAMPQITLTRLAFLWMVFFSLCSLTLASEGKHQPAGPADPHKVLGSKTCVKCHASEVAQWKLTPHFNTISKLHRQPNAKSIAKRLGIRSIKHDGRCVACHYTQQANPVSGRVSVVEGISCESCHGAAKDWLDIHYNYGKNNQTRLTETPEHRKERIEKSVANGMRNPHNVFLVAQSCYRCHTVGDEELVNVGEHNAGSLDFEFVTWSQGFVRHNFLRSDGKTNDPSSPERLRVMFIAGLIADLESSFRAVAKATEKATYGVTVAKRSQTAGKRLKVIASKTDNPHIQKASQIADIVKLRLQNSKQLLAAADLLAEIGYQFAEQEDGTNLTFLDGFIPSQDKWIQ